MRGVRGDTNQSLRRSATERKVQRGKQKRTLTAKGSADSKGKISSMRRKGTEPESRREFGAQNWETNVAHQWAPRWVTGTR